MNFLIKAAQHLDIKQVYYTPKKVKKIIELHLIMGNPPIK